MEGIGKSSSILMVPSLIRDIVSSLKDKLAAIKNKRCIEIWNLIRESLGYTNDDFDRLEINDQLWSAIKGVFDEKLCKSLVKFLSSFICQTGSFELTKGFFLFNLAAAFDQKKFYLHDSLVE